MVSRFVLSIVDPEYWLTSHSVFDAFRHVATALKPTIVPLFTKMVARFERNGHWKRMKQRDQDEGGLDYLSRCMSSHIQSHTGLIRSIRYHLRIHES